MSNTAVNNIAVNDTASPLVVAIDGPAGSGKSSVSRATATSLGFDYLDTGAAYRALAFACLARSIDTSSPDAVIAQLVDFDYEIGIDPADYFVSVGGEDVTDAIREPRVTAVVSAVARVPEVRAYLVALFRQIIAASAKSGIIVEGRDITTVVAPDAKLRILLTASEEARMGRRSAEISGESAETTAKQLASRDAADSRVVDFMNAADGVITVDSTDLDFDQTVAAVVDLVRVAEGRAEIPTN
ncbi:cytidylate kinase [Glaciihabitans tibetensis]|uniref:Cytidylate kinase n=1 Tax=Glaciihabitans tibetensis TaxID=1266600 RepID=A0A2T0VEP3_9MICO|nr:(d)CMP kinase [Glaciihabitans tibetensis]PRY68634.1 cytidylate kinase [Glaciihabitans tibetensis]